MADSVKKTQRKALGRGLRALVSTPSVPVARARGEVVESLAVESGNVAVAAAGLEVAPTIEPDTSAASAEPIESSDPLPAVGDNVFFLDVDCISGNSDQPRKQFRAEELKELSESIKALGVIQPILVRPISDYQYEIVAGERRWRAAKLADLTQVPVIVKEIEDREVLEIALVENIQRSNLTATEEARAYQHLMDEFNLTQRELAERVGKERASVANYLRLLNLPPEVLSLLDEGKIAMGHARAILTAKEPSVQRNLARKCVQEGLSVRAIEEIVSRSITLEKRKKKLRGAATDFPEVADKLRKSLGTKVLIKHDKKQKRGKVLIEYFSEEELDRIVDIMSA